MEIYRVFITDCSFMCQDIRNFIRFLIFFFFNDTATTEIYTLSLHDALPICGVGGWFAATARLPFVAGPDRFRSEEHTSELQSPCNLVCRLLLEKKKQVSPPQPSDTTRPTAFHATHTYHSRLFCVNTARVSIH